mmetsp:Transcript_58679/g.69980  ORF Transcript_58679/g.69980 Transcript_58679/m.69980 type:complete len:94 (-) Transcript_58679:31-312(-)
MFSKDGIGERGCAFGRGGEGYLTFHLSVCANVTDGGVFFMSLVGNAKLLTDSGRRRRRRRPQFLLPMSTIDFDWGSIKAIQPTSTRKMNSDIQ